jgi:hypothetical protein
LTDIKPGMFGLSQIGGVTGKLIRLGQKVVERQDYTYTHAFLVVSPEKVIEAEPGGAIFSPLSKYLDKPNVVFSDLPISLAVQETVAAWAKVGYNYATDDAANMYETVLRNRVVAFGEACQGIPYSYLDYFALALERFNIHIKAVENRVKREDRMICSQLVDWAYAQVGIHLFDDGRLPQDVTPGDLEGYIRKNSQ